MFRVGKGFRVRLLMQEKLNLPRLYIEFIILSSWSASLLGDWVQASQIGEFGNYN